VRREHKQFLLVGELVGSTIVNFLLNAAIAWFLFRSLGRVPLFGRASIANDTIGTAFILPLLTAIIATPLVAIQVAHKKLPLIAADELHLSPWARRSLFVRGAAVGLAAVAFIAIPLVMLWSRFGPTDLSFAHFVWFKASFAAGVGALVTPLIGWWALQAASRSD
jgi:hypothetical protein